MVTKYKLQVFPPKSKFLTATDILIFAAIISPSVCVCRAPRHGNMSILCLQPVLFQDKVNVVKRKIKLIMGSLIAAARQRHCPFLFLPGLVYV